MAGDKKKKTTTSIVMMNVELRDMIIEELNRYPHFMVRRLIDTLASLKPITVEHEKKDPTPGDGSDTAQNPQE